MGGHIDVLRQLVQFGADINSKEGKSGRTPLHIAIEAANDLVLSFLLEECKNTLNIEAITYGGLTAYQFASVLKNAAFQNNLKLRGAEPLTPPDTDDDSDIEDVDVPVQFTNFI
uniref:Uncharacterized protein n=1 Tax=Megaselia scalaris TaxID=36166 RepID=T1H556_MEGSC